VEEERFGPIFKTKGYIHNCANYRGIKHTSNTMKIWFSYLLGRSTIDAIYLSSTEVDENVPKYKEKGLYKERGWRD